VINSLDFFVTTAFILVQWRVTVLLLRAARKQFSGSRLTAARCLVLLLNIVLAMGFTVSYSEVVSILALPPGVTPFFGAATLIYVAIAGAAVTVHAVWNWIDKRYLGPVNPGRRQVLKAAGNTFMAAPLLVMGYGSFIERLNFQVREVDVPVGGLPPDLEGLRILQLSDIHLSAFLSERELERVIDSANELKANLAVVTGDLISSRGDPLDACIRQVARLKSDSGIWGCLGNHERYARVENYTTAAAARAGVRFLRSQTAPLRFGSAVLNLAGVDYQPWSSTRTYLTGKGKLIAPGAVNVLLSHNPDVFPVAVHQGYNLLLAGHTHGGQISVEILDQSINPARFFTPYIYGLYRSGAASAYVTRGIGTIGIPVRLGAPPEISLLRLRKA
jgi:predicted MPP superfamily phosphohydrolase